MSCGAGSPDCLVHLRAGWHTGAPSFVLLCGSMLPEVYHFLRVLSALRT